MEVSVTNIMSLTLDPSVHGLTAVVVEAAFALCAFVKAVFKTFLSWIRIPAAAWLLWLLLSLSTSGKFLTPSDIVHLPSALVCNAPIISVFWHYWPCSPVDPALLAGDIDFSKLAVLEADSMQMLLAESVGLTDVHWDLTQANLRISDLIRLVQMSDLASKNALVSILENLRDEIKDTGAILRRLSTVIVYSAKRYG